MTAHPGAYCSPVGATDKTKTDTPMVCSVGKPGERARWRRNGPSPARTPRRRGRNSTTGGGTLPQVNTGIDPTRPAAPVPAPAAEQSTPDEPLAHMRDVMRRAGEAPDAKTAEKLLLNELDPDQLRMAGGLIGVDRNSKDGPGDLAERYANALHPAAPVTDPDPVQATVLPPRSALPLEPPNGGWGIDQGLMHFDGALGQLWNGLDDDRHLKVDGKPLGNVVKDLGEGITMRRHSSQHALDELRRIGRQLPADSRPGRQIDAAINRLDAPAKPMPELPDNTPTELRTLVQELNALPLVRRGTDYGMGGRDPYHPDDVAADIARRWSAGQLRPFQIESELSRIRGWGHESMEGHEEIRVAISKATRDVMKWGRRPGRRLG